MSSFGTSNRSPLAYRQHLTPTSVEVGQLIRFPPPFSEQLTMNGVGPKIGEIDRRQGRRFPPFFFSNFFCEGI